MVGQVLVELGGGGADLGQVVPGARGEVVVLDVVPEVEVEEVPETEVVVSFHARDKLEMLGNSVSCRRVRPYGEKGDIEHVDDRIDSP